VIGTSEIPNIDFRVDQGSSPFGDSLAVETPNKLGQRLDLERLFASPLKDSSSIEVNQNSDHHEGANSLAQALIKSMRGFAANVSQKFANIELVMALAGLISTKRLDWLAYAVDSIAEKIENALLGGKIDSLSAFTKGILTGIAKILGIKNQQGQIVESHKDLEEKKEALISGLNIFLSVPTLIISLLGGLKKIFGSNDDKSGLAKGFVGRIITEIAPVINSSLMGASSAGKSLHAEALQKLAPQLSLGDAFNKVLRQEVNANFNSSVEDKLCAVDSLSLSLVSWIGRAFPKINHVLEAILGIFISSKSIFNAVKGLDPNNDKLEKYTRSFVDKCLGHCLGAPLKWFSSLVNFNMPDPEKFFDLIKEPTSRKYQKILLESI
jgi:hypothetical protein